MADQPGIVGPESFPIRDPRDKSLSNGRILNPPRFVEFGGFDKASKWSGKKNTSAQVGDENVIQLERGGPTGVKGAYRSSEKSMGA